MAQASDIVLVAIASGDAAVKELSDTFHTLMEDQRAQRVVTMPDNSNRAGLCTLLEFEAPRPRALEQRAKMIAHFDLQDPERTK